MEKTITDKSNKDITLYWHDYMNTCARGENNPVPLCQPSTAETTSLIEKMLNQPQKGYCVMNGINENEYEGNDEPHISLLDRAALDNYYLVSPIHPPNQMYGIVFMSVFLILSSL